MFDLIDKVNMNEEHLSKQNVILSKTITLIRLKHKRKSDLNDSLLLLTNYYYDSNLIDIKLIKWYLLAKKQYEYKLI